MGVSVGKESFFEGPHKQDHRNSPDILGKDLRSFGLGDDIRGL